MPILSSYLLDGTSMLRCGIWPIASWRPIISDILDTWTPSPCPLMVLSAHQEGRTAKLCCGTLTMASICTLSITPTQLTPSLSPPIDTGCVLLLAPLSRFGISRVRILLKSWGQRSLDLPVQSHHSVSHLHGVLMDKHCLLDILITLSGSGKSVRWGLGKESITCSFATLLDWSICSCGNLL